MKKVRYVRNKIKFSLDWDGTSTISKLREDLDAIEKLGAKIKIITHNGIGLCDGGGFGVQMFN